MMNHQWTAALVGAAVLGIPAIASQQGDPLRSLKAALDSTHSALNELVGLEPRLAAHLGLAHLALRPGKRTRPGAVVR